jgi:hypothetical protein
MFALALLLLLPSVARGEELRVIAAGHEAEILALAAPIALGGEVAAGYRLDGIRVDRDTFAFVLGGEGRQSVELRFAPDAGPLGHRVEVVPPENALDAAALLAVRKLRGTVAPHVDRAFWDSLFVVATATRAAPVRAPRPLLPWAIAIAAFVAIVFLEWRGGSLASAAWALPIALSPIVAWYFFWGAPAAGLEVGRLESWFEARERQLVQLALAAAIASLFVAAIGALRRARREGSDLRVWLDAGAVLAWSLVVRFGLTEANVLTDGGSGWSRLLEYRRGFSGLAVLVDLVLPDRPMWESILVPRLVAALSPPVLVLLARALRADRATAFFAGLALASLPLHAALYSSDFESGAVVTFMLTALAIVASGERDDSAVALGAGLTLVGYALWGRPEALVAGLPLLVIAWSLPRRLWLRCAAVAAVAWLGGLAFVRLVSLQQLVHGTRSNLAGPWGVLPWRELLTTGAILPFWLWLPSPIGLLRLRGRARVVAAAGLLGGLVPEHTAPTMYDPTATYLEFFRYGSFALPWLCLFAGAGLAAIAESLDRLAGSPAHRLTSLRSWPRAALALLLLATPLANREYLSRRYGPAVDEEAFREALARVPRPCRLIVPDDEERGSRGSLEVMKRYVEIALDTPTTAGGSPPPLIGLSAFLREQSSGGAAHHGGEACWYFYRGSYCHDGFEGDPPAACSEVLDRFPSELVWSRDVEYRSHRLITRPGRTAAPWYEPRLALSLYRIAKPVSKGE